MNEEQTGAAFFRDLVPALFAVNHASARVLAQAILTQRGTRPTKVLEVGAGSGVFGVAFAAASPTVTVTAADWKDVLATAREIARKWNVLDRFSFAEGDLFDSEFGRGFDVATLANILHMESPERCQALLQKVYHSLAPEGTVAILEFVPNDERTGEPTHLIFAVNMLVHTAQGGTYTFREMQQWLLDAGFENVRRLETPSPSPAILADKPARRAA
jgi:ubiquinone/menaquinone biosynthesis C-methylase UbiE